MSKTVIIKAKDEKTHLPKAVTEDIVKRLGSEYRGQAPLRPLTKEEEEKYLYQYLGVDDRDPELSDKLKRFWADLTLKVPSGGAVLEIDTDPNTGQPLKLMDYLHYRVAKLHSKVAETKEQSDGDSRYKFYIDNPERKKEEQYQTLQLRKEAFKKFAMVSEKPEEMDYVLRAMGEGGVDRLSDKEKENQLSIYVDNNPKKFLSVATDEDLKYKAFIEELIEYNVVERVGQSYIYIDKTIAETKREMVQFIKSQKNTKVVNELKAKLREINPKRKLKTKQSSSDSDD